MHPGIHVFHNVVYVCVCYSWFVYVCVTGVLLVCVCVCVWVPPDVCLCVLGRVPLGVSVRGLPPSVCMCVLQEFLSVCVYVR